MVLAVLVWGIMEPFFETAVKVRRVPEATLKTNIIYVQIRVLE